MTEATSTTPRRLRYELGSVVVPGDRLGAARAGHGPGPGTYLRQGHLYAATAGRLQLLPQEQQQDHGSSGVGSLLTVVRQEPFLSSISVGQVVLCRVVRMALQQQSVVEIVAVQNNTTSSSPLLSYRHEGVIRREDVWPAAVVTATTAAAAAGDSNSGGGADKSNEQSSPSSASLAAFRPGDLVVARVLSLGDTRRYFLTTAEPHLGVIHAISARSGKPMVPVSWNEMICPETGVKEGRKCAKPVALGGATRETDGAGYSI